MDIENVCAGYEHFLLLDYRIFCHVPYQNYSGGMRDKLEISDEFSIVMNVILYATFSAPLLTLDTAMVTRPSRFWLVSNQEPPDSVLHCTHAT